MRRISGRETGPEESVDDQDLLDCALGMMPPEIRLIADRRMAGELWPQIADAMGGTPDGRRKQFERAVSPIAQSLRERDLKAEQKTRSPGSAPMTVIPVDWALPGFTDSVEQAVHAVRGSRARLWLDLIRRDQSERWRRARASRLKPTSNSCRSCVKTRKRRWCWCAAKSARGTKRASTRPSLISRGAFPTCPTIWGFNSLWTASSAT